MHSLMLVPPAGDDLQAFHSTRSTIFAPLTRFISILISSAPLLGMVLPQPVLAKPFRIGVSNAFVDTWRSQMLDALNKTNDELKGRSLTSDLAAHQDFKSIGVIDPPGLAATTALRIVVRLLEGKKIKADVLSGSSNNRLYIPLPGNIEQRDLEETLEKHAQEPDSRYIDVVADEADVSRLFEP